MELISFNFTGSYYRKILLNETGFNHCYLRTEILEKHKTECEYKIEYDNEGHEQCSVLGNSTDWVYSEAESIVAGLGATFQSIAGSTLNLLIILALLRKPSLRKEHLTPFILSLAATDLIYSTVTLPIIAARNFAR